MKSHRMMWSIILILILTSIAAGLYNSFANKGGIVAPHITDFESCANAGNPVMESYPRQCRSADGRLFVEEISRTGLSSTDGCAIGGCSGQLCGEAEDMEDLVTTCEYRPQYACYYSAVCARQTTGECGWTDTAELRACIASTTRSTEDIPTDAVVY